MSQQHTEPGNSTLTSLTAISPLDGRYHAKSQPLAEYASEAALMRYRAQVEIAWLQCLTQHPGITELNPLSTAALDYLSQLHADFSTADAAAIKHIEATCNHDVKAVEYWLRDKLTQAAPEALRAELSACAPFLHFACTSADINNTAYALMQRDLQQHVVLPQLHKILQHLTAFAHKHAKVAMLARTHGQAASPTTLGKEILVFASRLQQNIDLLQHHRLSAKFSGAVGNYHAHLAAYPELDWPHICQQFLQHQLGLQANPHTTQIEPHDHLSAWLQSLCGINQILTDLCRDLWGYISLGYLQQAAVATEVGSSTMPHKINPIDFENAEGNLGIANALAQHLAQKLPISRFQRDLSDSTAMRQLGSVVGYTAIAYQALLKGLNKISPNLTRIEEDLAPRWEVVTEAIQSVLRRHGVPDAYEQLKQLSRGQAIDQATLAAFIQTQPLPETVKQQLLQLTPLNYLGNAAQQATQPDINTTGIQNKDNV